MNRVVGPALVVLLALSCGGGGGGGGGGPCAQVGAETCTKACACTEGPGCIIDSQTGLTVTFDTEADCRGFLVTLGCSDSSMPAYNDAAACLPLVQAATCTGSGTTAALAFPTDPVCETPPPPP